MPAGLGHADGLIGGVGIQVNLLDRIWSAELLPGFLQFSDLRVARDKPRHRHSVLLAEHGVLGEIDGISVVRQGEVEEGLEGGRAVSYTHL